MPDSHTDCGNGFPLISSRSCGRMSEISLRQERNARDWARLSVLILVWEPRHLLSLDFP